MNAAPTPPDNLTTDPLYVAIAKKVDEHLYNQYMQGIRIRTAPPTPEQIEANRQALRDAGLNPDEPINLPRAYMRRVRNDLEAKFDYDYLARQFLQEYQPEPPPNFPEKGIFERLDANHRMPRDTYKTLVQRIMPEVEPTMPVNLYTVKLPDGKKMGQIAATDATIQKALADLLGTRWDTELQWDKTEGKEISLKRIDAKTPKQAAALPPVIVDTDPPIDPTKIAGGFQTATGEHWKVFVANQGYTQKADRYVLIGSAPLDANWRPGQPIPEEKIAAWKADKRMVYDMEKGRYLISLRERTMWVFEPYWRESYKEALAKYFKPKDVSELSEDDLEALIEAMDKSANAEIKSAQAKLKEASELENSLRQQLISAMRTKEHFLKICDTQDAKGRPEAKKALEKIKKLPGIKALEVKGTQIHFFTERIYATPTCYTAKGVPPGKVFDIGEFRVEVDMKTGGIAFHNLTPGMIKEGYHHPHVAYPDGACLGEISANVPDMVQKLMIPELVQVLLRFLRSANGEEGGYASRLRRWQPVDPPVTPKPAQAINLNKTEEAKVTAG